VTARTGAARSLAAGTDLDAAPDWQTVQLVDQNGRFTGTAEVNLAHTPPPMLHRAFSVVITDGAGRLLLQRRAQLKSRFAGRWSNSCCGHPPPGLAVAQAARLRTSQELGVTPTGLQQMGTFVYQAQDPGSGLVEYEFDHVLLGRVAGPLRPAPSEVDEVRWCSRSELADLLTSAPCTPWLPMVLQHLDSDHWC
jgi:isopentenyl-diphosphate Delta-isomerase